MNMLRNAVGFLQVIRKTALSDSVIYQRGSLQIVDLKATPGSSDFAIASETGFHVVQSSRYFTLCQFQLLTGRQHQIRKHCALVGHALVGDPRYGEPKYNAMIAERYNNPRMFLHCVSIALLGQKFASPLSKEFTAILAPS